MKDIDRRIEEAKDALSDLLDTVENQHGFYPHGERILFDKLFHMLEYNLWNQREIA